MGFHTWASALLLLLAAGIHAQSDDRSLLKILVPPTTFKPLTNDKSGSIPHSQALFGRPSYGADKMIVGEIMYVTPDASKTGCDEDHVKDTAKSKPANAIFLVDRGDCSFVEKVRTAQKLGAKAVIIADNVCQCSTLQTEKFEENSAKGRTPDVKSACAKLAVECEKSLPFMADDGTGADISIPAFLIDFIDAQPLKDCLLTANDASVTKPLSGNNFKCAAGTKLIAGLEWDLPTTSMVDWKLWSSSDSEAVFKREFKTTALKLKDRAVFEPKYFIWNGEEWGCTLNDGAMCGSQCTDGGYYCNPDPDHDLNAGVSGKDVIDENLRQICIWKQGQDKKSPEIWWNYVTSFAETCHKKFIPTKEDFNSDCSEKVQATVPKLDMATVKSCVANSWTGKTNSLLKQEIKDRALLNILTLPTVVVNNLMIYGGVTTVNVLSSLCAGIRSNTAEDLSEAARICSCVDRTDSVNMMQCIDSQCGKDERYCAKTKECYDEVKYQTRCTDICGPKDVYCSTLLQCIDAKSPCPSCEAATPVYCSNSKKCVATLSECGSTDEGTSAFSVFVITIFVVSVAGCILYGFWRRQKAKLHDDVRAILSSYMALDGENDDAEQSRVSRQARRVEPEIGASSSVGGQDAAQYI